jgi:hypothetical protein
MVQTKQVEFCKEVDDVAVLLVKLVTEIKAGKSIGDIVSGNVQPLIDAVAGVDQLSAEAAERKVFMQTLGYRTGELTDALLPK